MRRIAVLVVLVMAALAVVPSGGTQGSTAEAAKCRTRPVPRVIPKPKWPRLRLGPRGITPITTAGLARHSRELTMAEAYAWAHPKATERAVQARGFAVFYADAQHLSNVFQGVQVWELWWRYKLTRAEACKFRASHGREGWMYYVRKIPSTGLVTGEQIPGTYTHEWDG